MMAPVSRNIQQSNNNRWFNANILGRAVDALQEEELAQQEDNSANAEEALEVNEEVTLDDRYLPLAFSSVRHLEDIIGIDVDESAQTWRMRERMKTVSVALVVCLNIGVDPPDVKKTEPCARMECWINPLTLNSQRALETIGNNLQKQYERWQPRARYRQSLDPTVEEVRFFKNKSVFFAIFFLLKIRHFRFDDWQLVFVEVPEMNVSFSIITDTVCPNQQLMEKSGCSTALTRSISL